MHLSLKKLRKCSSRASLEKHVRPAIKCECPQISFEQQYSDKVAEFYIKPSPSTSTISQARSVSKTQESATIEQVHLAEGNASDKDDKFSVSEASGGEDNESGESALSNS